MSLINIHECALLGNDSHTCYHRGSKRRLFNETQPFNSKICVKQLTQQEKVHCHEQNSFSFSPIIIQISKQNRDEISSNIQGYANIYEVSVSINVETVVSNDIAINFILCSGILNPLKLSSLAIPLKVTNIIKLKENNQ